jgi:hypothetical protein
MSEDKGSWGDGDIAYVTTGADGLPRMRKGGASIPTAMDITTLLSETDGKPSLDYLYEEAKKIGRVKVEEEYNRKSTEVSICFNTKGGSRVWAKGQSEDVNKAFQNAIKEARLIRDGYR